MERCKCSRYTLECLTVGWAECTLENNIIYPAIVSWKRASPSILCTSVCINVSHVHFYLFTYPKPHPQTWTKWTDQIIQPINSSGRLWHGEQSSNLASSQLDLGDAVTFVNHCIPCKYAVPKQEIRGPRSAHSPFINFHLLLPSPCCSNFSKQANFRTWYLQWGRVDATTTYGN